MVEPAEPMDEPSGAVPLSELPELSSNPSASAKLYLDFDGDSGGSWGAYSVPQTPAYDRDGNAASFSDGELASIQEIWARIAEKYSPFDVDVTTIRPASFADRIALHAVIGGNGAWIGGGYGGVAYVGGFYNSSPNKVWIFEDNLGNGHATYVAEAAAHEAGHGFGLEHQSEFDASGRMIEEYYEGTALSAPIMGNSYYATRGLWWRGPSVVASNIQDDISILVGTKNGFGYRADDHPSSVASATVMTVAEELVGGAGIIEKAGDIDAFSFSTGAGQVTFTAAGAQHGGMLDLKLELRTAAGALIVAADTASLGETISLTLEAGSYRLVVASHGDYGDLGQYSISGTVVPSLDQPEPPPEGEDDPLPPPPESEVLSPEAPSGLRARAFARKRVRLNWNDNSSDETGFHIQWSPDGATWFEIAALQENADRFADRNLCGGRHHYRISAFNDAGQSDWTEVAVAMLGRTRVRRMAEGSRLFSEELVPAAEEGLFATPLTTMTRVRVWQGG